MRRSQNMLTAVDVDEDRQSSGGIARTAAAAERLAVFEPGSMERDYWKSFWRFRELFAILAWRDLAIRHKQTAIGIAWSLIRPLVTVLIFTFVFSRIAKLPSEGTAPYALMVFAGMLAWTLLSNIISQAGASLVSNSNLIGKVYFPRVILPAATVVVTLADTAISLLLFGLMMVWFEFVPDWRIVIFPVFVTLAVLTALGPALWIAAVNVRYRDFQYIAAFALQFGVYISPVGFSSSAVPKQWRLLYSLNPAVGVIDGFRWCLLRGAPPLYWPGLLCSVVITSVALWAGIKYFRKAESSFADVI